MLVAVAVIVVVAIFAGSPSTHTTRTGGAWAGSKAHPRQQNRHPQPGEPGLRLPHGHHPERGGSVRPRCRPWRDGATAFRL